MIREVKRDDIPVCVDIIRKSFETVADEFGFTIDNAPRFTAFATTEDMVWICLFALCPKHFRTSYRIRFKMSR